MQPRESTGPVCTPITPVSPERDTHSQTCPCPRVSRYRSPRVTIASHYFCYFLLPVHPGPENTHTTQFSRIAKILATPKCNHTLQNHSNWYCKQQPAPFHQAPSLTETTLETPALSVGNARQPQGSQSARPHNKPTMSVSHHPLPLSLSPLKSPCSFLHQGFELELTELKMQGTANLATLLYRLIHPLF